MRLYFVWILTWLFGCAHTEYSWPRTPRRPHRIKAAQLTGTYVVCERCATELPYSLDKMCVVRDSDSTANGAPLLCAGK